MANWPFDEAEAFSLLKTLVSCKTVNPPGNEASLAQQLSGLLAKEGLTATVDEFAPGRANLLLRIKGKVASPALLLTGHLDTVPVGSSSWQHDPFACEIQDGIAYGRGTADMKSGVAAMLYALILLCREGSQPQQDIVFLATADEEVSRQGAERFVKQGGMADIGAALVGEPSNGDLLLAHKGAMWTKVSIYGQTAHGSMPHLGINAVSKMARFINILTAQEFTCAPDALLGQPTFSVNTINGGVATNVVPDYCTCNIDIRIIPGQTEQEVRHFIESALAKAGEGDKNFKAEYEFLNKAMPVACTENHHIINDFMAAAGKQLQKRGVNYYTDASTLTGGKNMPLIIYGPGDDKQAHQPNEHVHMEKFYQAITVYKNFIRDFKI